MEKAVIFDLDGVIVDTANFHYQGWKKLADELGVPFDEKANEKIRGVPRRESLLRILGYDPGEEKVREYTDRKNQYYLEMVRSLNPSDLLPGAIDIISKLKQSGYKIAIASSSKNARLVLQLLRIENAFDAVVDGNDISQGKPDPELFLKAADQLHVPPSGCLVVEDAESGIQAARAAGMRSLGIGDSRNLEGAQAVISGLDQVDVPEISRLLS